MSETPTSTSLEASEYLTFGVGTDVGRKRDENQDSYGIIEKGSSRFFIVADGMGGAKGGAVASRLAISSVEKCLEASGKIGLEDIVSSVNIANAEIFSEGVKDEKLAGMGTTLCGVAFEDLKMIVVNVGDSRVYRIRDGEVHQLTEDHTLVNDLLRTGAITLAQAENHPVAHMLTRSLGPAPQVEVDCWIAEDGPAKNDIYLLCSDGLYNVVEEDEMLSIVEENSLDDAVQALIDLANSRGGPDNITIILVEVSAEFPKSAKDYTSVEYPRSFSQANEEPFAYANGRAAQQKPELDEFEIEKPKRKSSSVQMREKRLSAELEQSTNSAPLKWFGLMVIGLILGFFLSETKEFLHTKRLESGQKVLVNPLATEIAHSPVALNTSKPEMQLSVPENSRLVGLDSGQSFSDGFDINSNLTKSQVDGMKQRKATLENLILQIDKDLNTLSSASPASLDQRLKEIKTESAALEAERYKLSQELGNASRNLALWIERMKRLQKSDPVDMASEVAFSSTFVKEKKDLFEKATWAYLREVEVWRYNPSDEALTKRVSELGRSREQRRRELASAVKAAIEKSKQAAEDSITSLSQNNDELEAKLKRYSSEQELIEIILKGDQSAKSRLSSELEEQRSLLKTELQELSNMISK
ncbi:MAG: Stp1/IreP family PP2C-type Ser/Thr phosphatase [Deltaproteobacteria bacterium]|nr:Stp1/IreP family PP2C-type Ser/Thr phosphatase [Deltaproteobacteria bacterium]